MQYTYIKAFCLNGLKQSSINDSCIYKNSGISAFLTNNANDYFFEIDFGLSLSVLNMNQKIGRKLDNNDFEKIENQIAKLQNDRLETIANNVVLVVLQKGTIRKEKIEVFRKYDQGFFTCNIEDNSFKIDEKVIEKILSSVILSLQYDVKKKKLREGIYLKDDNGHKYYSSRLELFPPTIRINYPLEQENIEAIKRFLSVVDGKNELMRIVNLYCESIEIDISPLKSFVLSWAGLEMFINRFFEKLKANFDSVKSEKNLPVILEPITNLPENRFGVGNKFKIISFMLCEDKFNEDVKKFKAINRARQNCYHAGKKIQDLPLNDTQLILRRFIIQYLQNYAE